MSKYAGSRYWKVARLKGRAVCVTIAAVNEVGKPDLVFEDGSILSANATNCGELIRLFGEDSDGWVGREIELYVGETTYQGAAKESVLVRAVDELPLTAKANGDTVKQQTKTTTPKAERKPPRDDTEQVPFR